MSYVNKLHYVYVLKYVEDGLIRYYVGITSDVRLRLRVHKHKFAKRGLTVVLCGTAPVKDKYEAVYIESLAQAEMITYGPEVVKKRLLSLGGNWQE